MKTILCINCNGTGKVSSGVWLSEQENFIEKESPCMICHGEGIINIINKKKKKK